MAAAAEEVQQERVLTKAELKDYDGSQEGKGPYLAVLGQVFDVSKGKDHYGPGGGYSFFSGIDGSRAFVTGEFNEGGKNKLPLLMERRTTMSSYLQASLMM